MMRALAVLLTTLFCSAIYGGVVSEFEAREKAQRFVGEKHLQIGGRVRGRSSKDTDRPNANFYVFNIENNEGFVIVSGDDRTPEILGFADSGRMDVDNLPSNVAAWLDAYSQQISSLGSNVGQTENEVSTHARGSSSGKSMGEQVAIAPLITTTWDQGSPYNQYLIEIDGAKAQTGCAATAMAQIMRFYSFPEASKALPSYISTTHIKYIDALPASMFDWDGMGTESTPATADEGKQIAKLMKYCGVATQMDYSPYGSGTYVRYVESAFKDYFFYDTARKVERDDYQSNADWEKLIYNELKNHRPVFYGGVTRKGSGHAFVCDGYQYDNGNYFHINWGWSGSCDGYFLLSTLDSHDDGNGYVKEQSAIISLKPGAYTRPDNIDYEDDIRKEEEYEASLVWPFNTFDFEKTSSSTVSVDAHKNTISGDVVIPATVTIDGMNYQVTSINSGFWNCDEMVSITLPETMQTIYAGMNSCKGLKRVYIPASVQSISLSLNNCTMLSNIEVSQESPWLTTYEGVLYTKDMTTLIVAPYALAQTSFVIPEGVQTMTYAFAGHPNVTSVSLPSTLTNSIQAFSTCRGLKTVELANNLATLSEKTFEGCTSITSVKANCTSPKAIDENTFASVVYSQATLTVPYGCASIYKRTAGWKKFSTIIEQGRPANLPVKVKAKNYTRIYGEPNPTFDYSVTDGPLTGSVSLSCTASTSSAVGTYPIVVSVTGSDFVETANGTLTVLPAPLQISAASYTITQGEPLPTFEIGYEGFKLGEDESVLDTKAQATCGITDSNQPGSYTIVVAGAVAKNYTCNYSHGTLTVLGQVPVVVTACSYTVEYGDELPALEYTETGGQLMERAMLSCDATSTSPVGVYPIAVTINDSEYAETVDGTLTIVPAPLYVTVGSYTIVQGDALPVFDIRYEGFKNGEAEDVLSAMPVVDCEAVEGSAPGEYPISLCGAEAENYDISYVTGILTVTEADPVSVTARSYTRVYGEDNPSLEYDVEGAALDGQPAISCEATASSPVGTYPIVVKKGDVRNYNDTYINGTLTITKAPLTITAQSYTRKQGEENPAFAVTCTGWKNGETESVLTKLPMTTCEAEATAAPGEYAITIEGAEAENYDISYVTGLLTVTEADPVSVTARSYTRVYGEDNPPLEYDVEGAALDGQPAISCEATASSPVGTYPIVVKKGDVRNYNDTYINGTLTITKAPLTITAQSYTRKQGEENPTFAVTCTGWKNGETEAMLTKLPVMTCTAEAGSAVGTYTITPSGAEAANYDISYVAGKLTVTQADPVTVTAKSYTRFYGDENPVFEYEASGAALQGEPLIECEATAASPVGTYTIKISKGGVKNFNDKYVAGKLTIKKAPLTITAKSYTRKQGEANPTLEVVYEGLKNGETAEVLTRQPSVSCSARVSSAPGEYEITVRSARASNYDITFVSGKLTVTEADPVTVTAKSYSRVYGEANPEFEYDVEGAALDGKPTLSCAATAKSPVGTYPITIKKGTVKNYNDTYVEGVLTITPAPLTITAKSYTRKQGEANPKFEVSYEGWKNKETVAVLTKQPTVTCEATEASAPGEYDITVSGAEAGNYDIKYVAGTLTVVDADAVVVTAKSYTREYGDANPTFEYEVSGAKLDGEPVITCEATVASPVGEYEIIVSKGTVKNYNDKYVAGKLTIMKAPLTITAKSYTRKQGEENPTFEVSYEGWKNGETEAVLTKLPTVSCEATAESEPGEYAITVSGGEAANYAISYVVGKLTVTEADAVVVTAKSYSRVYGEANPTFEYEVSGAQLDGEPLIECEATEKFPVGTYPIIIKKGGVRNYNDTYVDGVLTITPAKLTVTAGSYTKKQYDPMPEFAVSYEGFVNGETVAVLTKLPTVKCEATAASEPGEYAITVSGAEAGNYEISYVPGKLTATVPDAIGDATQTDRYIVRIYTVGGKPLKELQRGVNIVVMSDGTIRKVVVK